MQTRLTAPLKDGYKKCYKSYWKLSMNRRSLQVKTLSEDVMFVVVHRKELKPGGLSYIKENEDLAVYVCNILDHIREHLEIHLFLFKCDVLEDRITLEVTSEDAGVGEDSEGEQEDENFEEAQEVGEAPRGTELTLKMFNCSSVK